VFWYGFHNRLILCFQGEPGSPGRLGLPGPQGRSIAGPKVTHTNTHTHTHTFTHKHAHHILSHLDLAQVLAGTRLACSLRSLG